MRLPSDRVRHIPNGVGHRGSGWGVLSQAMAPVVADIGTDLFIAWFAFVPIAWITAAALIATDVKRKGGPWGWTLVLAFVFWPAGLYLWARTRGREQGRHMVEGSSPMP